MSLLNLIKPQHIKTTDHFWNTFDHSETEISARWIVRFLKEQRPEQGWEAFPLADLQAFYEATLKKKEDFYFNKLTSKQHVTLEGDNVVIHPSFVAAICGNTKLIES